MKYTVFQHRLKLNPGLNFSIAKIHCPIPTAFYELLQKNPNALVPPMIECFIYNNDSTFYDLKITNEVQDISSKKIENVRIGNYEFLKISFFPNLKHEKLIEITLPRDYTIISQILVPRSNYLLLEETNIVTFLPYDTMLIKMIDESTGRTQTFYKYLTNWVKRFESKKLNQLMRNVIEETFDKIISGYNIDRVRWAIKNKKVKNEVEYTRHLVKCIYNSLALLSPRYMNEAFDIGRNSSQFGQRIKYPQETLEEERGNCIDFTILFAYLIEMIGLNPVIVIVPKHAYVGWETWSNSGEYEYLETTMVGYSDFEQAFSKGIKLEEDFKNLDYNKGYKIDIKQCRKDGIYTYQEKF
jgi:hypothetical protein